MSATNGEKATVETEKVSRGTVSHTPVAGTDTLLLLAVTAHNSIKVPEKTLIAIRDAGYDAMAALAAKMLPKVSVQTRQGTVAGKVEDADKAWTRLQLDTPETVKMPKPKGAGKSKLEKLLATTFDAGKLIADTRALVAQGQDAQSALKAAGKAMGLKDEQLYDFGLVRQVEAKTNGEAKAAKVAAKAGK